MADTEPPAPAAEDDEDYDDQDEDDAPRPLRRPTDGRMSSREAFALEWYFPRLEFSLAWADFWRLPRHPAYKYELIDNRTILTPRPKYQLLEGGLDELAARADLPAAYPFLRDERVEPLTAANAAAGRDVFRAAFGRVPPFSLHEEDEADRILDDCWAAAWDGYDGPIIPEASFLLFEGGGPRSGRAEGLILCTRLDRTVTPQGLLAGRPHLSWLATSPFQQRHGVGRLLLRHALAGLRHLGDDKLYSTVLLGNAPAEYWHWMMGFKPVPLADQLGFARAARQARGTGGAEGPPPP